MTRDQVWQAFYDQTLGLIREHEVASVWYPIWQRRNRMMRFAIRAGAKIRHWTGEVMT